MRAVILAAGLGNRMGNHTDHLPKPLLDVAGKPLITYTLEALQHIASEIIVVTGYRGTQLQRSLQRIAPGQLTFAHNPRFQAPQSHSLAAARALTGADPFLLLMSDHLFAPGVVQLLAEEPHDRATVAADYDLAAHTPAYIAEATHLHTTPNGRVTRIGKHLNNPDALDAGAFHCSPQTWHALDAVGPDASLSDIFTWLANNQLLHTTDVSGHFWYDVDTPEDRDAAQQRLLASAR